MNIEKLFSIIRLLPEKNAEKNFAEWSGNGLVKSSEGNPIFYHGTPNADAIEAFSRAMSGANSGAQDAKMFMGFGSSVPSTANDYALTVPSRRIYPDNAGLHFGESGFRPGVFPLLYKSERPHIVDFGGGEYTERKMGQAAREAVEIGADALVVRNIIDSLGYGGEVGDVVAVRNPTQIKSIFNRGTFDPNDPNILRSLMPAGLLSGAALASPESVWAANRNLPPTDAIEPAWNPIEAFAGGLAAGPVAALAGVPFDLAADVAMDKLGGLLSSANGPSVQQYGGGMGWR